MWGVFFTTNYRHGRYDRKIKSLLICTIIINHFISLINICPVQIGLQYLFTNSYKCTFIRDITCLVEILADSLKDNLCIFWFGYFYFHMQSKQTCASFQLKHSFILLALCFNEDYIWDLWPLAGRAGVWWPQSELRSACFFLWNL